MKDDQVKRTICICGSAIQTMSVFGYEDDEGNQRIFQASCVCNTCKREWSPEITPSAAPKETTT